MMKVLKEKQSLKFAKVEGSMRSHNVRYYYQTIDLDNCDKEGVERILHKILGRYCCQGAIVKPSAHKGSHIILFCSKKCDECRIVFDDTERFRRDMKRPDRRRNVLFHDYKYYMGKGLLPRGARSLRPAVVKPTTPKRMFPKFPPEQGGDFFEADSQSRVLPEISR